ERRGEEDGDGPHVIGDRQPAPPGGEQVLGALARRVCPRGRRDAFRCPFGGLGDAVERACEREPDFSPEGVTVAPLTVTPVWRRPRHDAAPPLRWARAAGQVPGTDRSAGEQVVELPLFGALQE